MKRVSVVLLCLFAFSAHSDNVQKSPFYFKLDGGLSYPKENFDKDFYPNVELPESGFFGAGIGYMFNDRISSEISYTFRPTRQLVHSRQYIGNNSEEVRQDFSNSTLMWNLRYHFSKIKFIRPYILGGAGISRNYAGEYFSRDVISEGSITRSSTSSTKYAPAWNIGLGGTMNITSDFSLDLFYRYTNLGKIGKISVTETTGEIYNISPGKIKTHETGISLIFGF